jgi:hypothetical protein
MVRLERQAHADVSGAFLALNPLTALRRRRILWARGIKMSKQYAPHEPDEKLLSVDDAFRDADRSEARWQAFEQGRHLISLHDQPASYDVGKSPA